MSPWYRRIFPTRLAPHRHAVQEFITTRQGYRLATSTGGVLTGRGADIILIDDPSKPEEALSDARRNATNEWFLNTLYSRLNDKCRGSIVIIMQRLHEDDLVGHVLGQEPWEVVNFPAIAEAEVAADSATFSYRLDRNKLRQARSREGRYLLRTNLVEEDPAKLWSHYLLLVAVEEAFKNLKGDLAIRPVFHQLEARIEAHIFIAFLAYCLHVTLARRLHALAPGLTPRSVLEKFAAVQMIDVHLPTTDGRELVLTRYTEPEPELNLLLNKLKLDLPAQPPPKITASAPAPPTPL